MILMDKEKELAKISEEIGRCPLCKQWGEGRPVPGEGYPDADIVFIGEAPGRKEADEGRPFVGRSGRFLRAVMKKFDLKDEEVFITSPVKYFPLQGTPTKENILHGRAHLLKQLSIIDPSFVVLLGNTACVALLDRKAQIMKEHGKVIHKDKKTYLITFHPAFAMRFSEGRKGFIKDFEKLKSLVDH
jgi:uracil-DNA glycosylase family 4